MERATQLQLGRQILASLDAGTGALAEDVYRNPVSDYTCPEQAAREREILFKARPLIVGLSGDLPDPGCFLTNDHAGAPILAARGKDGVVRAFLNVCRHRGSKLAQGCGRNQGVFNCPYHAWSYGSDGRLLAIPDAQAFAGLDKASHGLRPLACIERHGLIWVHPDPRAALDAAALLGPIGAEIDAYRLGNYHHFETCILRKKLNWKLVLDTFLEGYHIRTLHKNTIAAILPGAGAQSQAIGEHLRFVIPRNTFGQLRHQPEQDWDVIRHSAIVYILFPNVALIVQGDHVETWRVYPLGVDESVMEVSLYTPEAAVSDSAKRHWDRNMDLLLRTVEQEDFPLAEDMQRNFASGAQDHVTFGRNEPSLHHFHRAVRAALDGPARAAE